MRKGSYPGFGGVIEDTLHLLAGRTLPGRRAEGRSRGILVWQVARSGRIVATAGYQLDEVAGRETLRLGYALDGKLFHQAIKIVTTPQRLGGSRRWYECPGCDGRVGKLYLPMHAPAFLCRRCHNLTYTSSRTSRRWDALARRLGQETGGVNRLFRGELRARLLTARPVGRCIPACGPLSDLVSTGVDTAEYRGI